MRRVAIALICLAVLGTPVMAAERPQLYPGQYLYVYIYLRAAGGDAVDLCQDEPFGKEARVVGHQLAEAIGFPAARIVFDEDVDPYCMSIDVQGPLARKTAGHKRQFVFDGGKLSSLAIHLGYAGELIDVCVPFVSVEARTISGSARPDPIADCEYRGFEWNNAAALSVTFGPSGSDVARGLGSAFAWLLTLSVLGVLAWTRWGRAWHFRFFRRHRVLTGFLCVPVAIGLGMSWQTVGYRSGFVHVLEMQWGMPAGVEAALLLLGWLGVIAATVAVVVRVGHEARRAFPVPEAEERHPLGVRPPRLPDDWVPVPPPLPDTPPPVPPA